MCGNNNACAGCDWRANAWIEGRTATRRSPRLIQPHCKASWCFGNMRRSYAVMRVHIGDIGIHFWTAQVYQDRKLKHLQKCFLKPKIWQCKIFQNKTQLSIVCCVGRAACGRCPVIKCHGVGHVCDWGDQDDYILLSGERACWFQQRIEFLFLVKWRANQWPFFVPTHMPSNIRFYSLTNMHLSVAG